MKVCTSINVFFDWNYIVPVETQIQRVYDAGFRHMDMNFWDWCSDPISPFRQDNWRDWVEGIAKKAQALNVKFTQAHADVYNFYTGDASRYELYMRSIEGAAMLGVPWITFHPSSRPDFSPETEQEIIKENIEYYKPIVEIAEKFKVGIALENMRGGINQARQLNQLVDGLDSPYVGVCWDTGHAHCAAQPQAESIHLLGHRLHALHIQDSDGITDQHMPPHFGTIEWDPIMKALRDINYPGDFTFEGHVIVRRVPEGCQADALRLLYRIGEELVGNVY